LGGHVKPYVFPEPHSSDESHLSQTASGGGPGACSASVFFVEYTAVESARPSLVQARLDIDGLSAAITAMHQQGAMVSARVSIEESGPLVQLVVEHKPGLLPTGIPGPGRCDVLVLMKADGHLLVSTDCNRERERYRQRLGEFFGDSKQLFRRSCRYVSRPLVERGADALTANEFGAVKSAVLRQLRFEAVGTMETIVWKANNLGSQLNSPLGQLLCRHRELREFRLELSLGEAQQLVTVDVRVPYLIRYSHLAARCRVAEFLESSGFLIREPSGEAAP
jgi:hypothetical protein